MKELILTILLSLSYISIFDHKLPDPEYEHVPAKDKDIDNLVRSLELLNATLYMEERTGDTLAVYDDTGAWGCLQITPIMIAEANRISGRHYNMSHAFYPKYAIEIWLIVQNYWNPDFNRNIGASLWIEGNCYAQSEYGRWYVNEINKIVKFKLNKI